MNYLKSISIDKKEDYRLKKLRGQTIEFAPGVNFLIGENGAGKSSLLSFLCQEELRNQFQAKTKLDVPGVRLNLFFFDTEKMSPRVSHEFTSPLDVNCRFMSHGESSRFCLENMIKQTGEKEGDSLIMVDEPENGLSPWRQKKLRALINKYAKTNQFIIATHSLVLTRMAKGRLIHLSKEKVEYYEPPKSYDWKVL